MRLKRSKFILLCASFIFIFFSTIFMTIIILDKYNLKTRAALRFQEIQKSISQTMQKAQHEIESDVRSLIIRYSLENYKHRKINPWKIANMWPNDSCLTADPAPELGFILKKLSRANITHADFIGKGTQLKILVVLENKQKALLKPQWYKRDDVIHGKAYDGWDRHNGEIVSFHLNRIMGFNRAPIAVGRNIDLMTEIIPVASDSLLNTFFIKDNNTCFYGKCLYCKGPETGVCAKGTKLEAAIVHWLPDIVKLRKYRHPWGRTYKENVKARWELAEGAQYCADLKKMPLYRFGRILLDMMDTSIFDYLIGNADRHHYEVNNSSFPMMVLIDNAKSFGNPFLDEESILTPLKHCQILRLKTFQRLHKLSGGVLVRVLKTILESDPLVPLLAPSHYNAINRRLEYVLQFIEKEKIQIVSNEPVFRINTTVAIM